MMNSAKQISYLAHHKIALTTKTLICSLSMLPHSSFYSVMVIYLFPSPYHSIHCYTTGQCSFLNLFLNSFLPLCCLVIPLSQTFYSAMEVHF